MVLLKVEFGPMAKHEKNAKNGDLFTTGKEIDSSEAVSYTHLDVYKRQVLNT